MRRIAFGLVALPLALLAVDARADGRTAMAETLFQEGRALLAKGAFADACPKLAESHALDPGDGTLLALALCHEGEGKLAQAWSELTVLATKSDTRADRAERARERIAAIEPQLARMAIVVPPTVRAAEPALEIVRDGIVLGRAAWGTASPVDAGTHVVEARAPGKKTARIEVTLASGRVSEVVVPPLEAVRVDAAPAPPIAKFVAAAVASPEAPAARSESGDAMRTMGLVVGGLGVVAIGTGVYFGARALGRSGRANDLCPLGRGCSAEALAANDDAKSFATTSNVAIIGGVAATTAGVLFYLVAPRAKTVVTPYASANGAGAALTSSF